MLNYLTRLFCHVAWADRRTLDSLRACPAAQPAALPLLAHLLAAEHVWLARLERRDPRHSVWPRLGLDACAALAAENETAYDALLKRLTAAELDRPLRYRTTSGAEFSTPVIDVFMQLITHGAYHRGQIAKAIGGAGGAAVNTDFITFARETPSAG